MQILGIDPGSVNTGYGIVTAENQQLRYITSGCIKIGKLTWPNRLRQIYADLNAIIKRFLPDYVAVETVFVSKNPNSALKLGQARGAAITTVANHSIPIAEYSPRQVKQAVVGHGNAEKHQVQAMVQLLLNLTAKPQADAADALALAICHSNHTGKSL